jgi:hypothetical protein
MENRNWVTGKRKVKLENRKAPVGRGVVLTGKECIRCEYGCQVKRWLWVKRGPGPPPLPG